MFRKPAFWIAFVVVAGLLVWYAVTNFPQAFPLVTLDLEMSRQEALDAARGLAKNRGWGPEGYRQAASFDLDFELQSYVELEGGGKAAFSDMLGEGLVSPYTWQVRHFREYETTETWVRFTPTGTPYGFFEKLPEDQAGAVLEAAEARNIAESSATEEWQVDLAMFELVEESQEVRPGGRVDHTFVYQRPGLAVGEEGRYRLRLVVSGDRFTELTHFVKIPEGFSRRYEEMRSANNGIAIGGVIAMALLYLVGGCVVGMFLLLKERWLLWKPAVKWAIAIAVVQLLMVLNQWPLAWMGYDTAVSSGTFGLQQFVLAVVQALGLAVVFALTVMAAESLSRKAFPHHVQLWRSWSPKTAASPTVAGLTIAGFLLVAGFIAYEVFLYSLANERLGWWTPSSPLFDPNIVATYFPWLTSIAISMWAGFWEEAVFRAIPIASAALLGRKFGGQKWWILGALVLQAVIFGAGHANYPQQPAYARIVEIFVPAVGFGVIYLALGLLPAIVLHYVVDVVFISLPVFASTAPGIWVDRAMVILLVLVPLWVVLRGRWKSGSWGEVAEEDYNRAWQPPPAPAIEPAAVDAPVAAGIGGRLKTAVLVAGAVGLVAWLVASDFSSDGPPLTVGRSEVLASAEEILERRGTDVPEACRVLSTVAANLGTADRFVWQEGGEEAYRELLGSYLNEPAWYVRRAMFEGDVAERAEEYNLWFAGDGELVRFRHRLPEQREGAEISEDEARTMAHDVVSSEFGLDPEELEEISAEPEQLEERRDWKIVFSDSEAFPLSEGEARIAVHIAGDEVVDSYRFVHVPEEWERAERNRGALAQVVQIVCTVTVILVFLAAAIFAIVRWSRGRFAVGTFVVLFGLVLIVGLVEMANSWPIVTASFSTAQPYPLQASVALAASVMVMIVISVALGLGVGLVHRWMPPQPAEGVGGPIAVGAALGVLLAGLAAAAGGLSASLEPSWGQYQNAAAVVPVLTAALGPVTSWIADALLLLLLVTFVHWASRGWIRFRVPMGVLFVVSGLVMVGSSGVDTVPRWLGAGVAVGIVLLVCYVLVLRHHLAVVPVVAAAVAVLGIVRQGALGLYPGVLMGSVVAAALICALSVVWFRRLIRDSTTP